MPRQQSCPTKPYALLVASEEEEEREMAALKASPKWTESDNLMVIRLVAVEHAEMTSAPLLTDK
jgi:hypothetical protein